MLTADPVNFLFLNTWYAEFPAFVSLTILGGILLAWYFRALPRKAMLQVGGAALFMLALNRKQYMFLPLALWLMAFAATALQAHGRAAIRQSARAWGLWLLAALLTVAWMGSSLGQLKMAAQANRTDTIFGAILPLERIGAGHATHGFARFMRAIHRQQLVFHANRKIQRALPGGFRGFG